MAKSATAAATATVIHNDALAPNHKWVLCPKCNAKLEQRENGYLYDFAMRHPTLRCPLCEVTYKVRVHVDWDGRADGFVFAEVSTK